MATGFTERIKAFIRSPRKAFEKEHKTSAKEAIIYSLKGFLIFAVLYAIMFGTLGILGQSVSLIFIPFIFIMIFVLGFLALLLAALWYHLWAYIFGARQGLKTTVKTLLFACTPTYIIGWIPIVNFIAGIWSMVLLGIGFMELQKLSKGRAIGAILIAVLIPLIIIGILLAWIISTWGAEILTASQSTSAFSVL